MTKTIEVLSEKLYDVIDGMSDYELITLHNKYCDSVSDYESRIYYMDELDDVMDEFSTVDIFNRVYYGNFNPNDSFFTFDGYDNLESLNRLSNYIYISEIIDYIIEEKNSLSNDDIQKILDDWGEE